MVPISLTYGGPTNDLPLVLMAPDAEILSSNALGIHPAHGHQARQLVADSSSWGRS